MEARPRQTLIFGCFLLCFVLCPGGSASAQSRIGVTAGLNWSTLGGEAPEGASYNRVLGFNAGIIGDIGLTKDVSLSFQPMWVHRGSDVSFDVGEDEPRDSLEVRLDYIDCLVMVKVFADNGFSYFTSGVGVGFLTEATIKDIRDGEEDAADLFRDFDVSVAFGVGFMIPAKNTLLTLELRYQQSLINMFDSDTELSDTSLAPRLRSSGFQLLASVLFPGKS